jgi:hypothetical protein
MRRTKLFMLTFICILLISSGCGNSNTAKEPVAKDTIINKDKTINKDTIKVDPEDFSDPH